MTTSTLMLTACPRRHEGGGGGGGGAPGARGGAGAGGGDGGACSVASAATAFGVFVEVLAFDWAAADEARQPAARMMRTMRRTIYFSPSALNGATVSGVRPIASGTLVRGASIAGTCTGSTASGATIKSAIVSRSSIAL